MTCARYLRKAVTAFAAAIAVTASGVADAHEFWMLPDSFDARPGASVQLSMHVGEYFVGDLVGLSQPFVTQLKRHAGTDTADLLANLPEAAAGFVQVPVTQSGTQVFSADTASSRVELPAGRFHAYLHDEGLDYVIALREKAGTADTPGRERFRRHVKTLVRVGDTAGVAATQATGQRLEIVPRVDPSTTPAGRDLEFQVMWEGKALPNALVKFWHRRGGQPLMIRTVTNPAGRVSVTPPWPGVWMASVVHMIPATDSPDVDWDSYWGNLTFELRAG